MASEKKTRGRKDGSTELAVIDLRGQAVKLYLAGHAPGEIATRLNRSIPRVYEYLDDVRTELIRSKKEFFDRKMAVYLEDAFGVLATHAQLLTDREFLIAADAEKVTAINDVFTTVTDRVLYLAAITAGRSVAPQAEQVPA